MGEWNGHTGFVGFFWAIKSTQFFQDECLMDNASVFNGFVSHYIHRAEHFHIFFF